ncbi:DNA (cytosine-5-)-methyltransferase [Dietzia maris]|uniref:DNA cytosine methyltransferase n=1 Tax=Dietzia maris TaxID=37915 RepID=UPI00343A056F
MANYEVVEICAGAGGQALGLERAGFHHRLAVELDEQAAATLRANRDWDIATGDVADRSVWKPEEHLEVDLLAGGVPCPPFSIAGRQLGASDERDLFAWSVELAATMRPRAVLLENVRGLSTNRFSAYRQRVLDRFFELGYFAEWRLLYAADYGVPQLRPRFVLVALSPEDAPYFRWPQPSPTRVTVGEALFDMMAEKKWKYARTWASLAADVGPTIVGGSKKHGGADLGPTRAKQAWANLYVNGLGIADSPPSRLDPSPRTRAPKLTIEMVAKIQGWGGDDWSFTGRKTSKYRQIGNAFPPPVAEAVGRRIQAAFDKEGVPEISRLERACSSHDPIYRILRDANGPLRMDQIMARLADSERQETVERRIANLALDFDLNIDLTKRGTSYQLGEFRGFVGQDDHHRHLYLEQYRSKVS